MPPKTKFSKEKIIDTAFEIARVEGIDQITIRKVADKMGSSIAPIYVNFTDIEELKKAVLDKIQGIFQEMLRTPYSENPFLNIGIVSVKFAREFSVFFRDMVMKQNTYINEAQPDMSSILELMKQDAQLNGFTDEELTEIFFKMRVFQLGLSVMDVNGLLPEDYDEEKLIKVLQSAGGDIITAAHLRKNDKNTGSGA
ncbi:TetR family transcriptional regulator [Cohnella kolymensis]|uniref:TetR family transcriptional regulator n=1 Tax=Cohnella kolymensis TaxID=1590652 RepID=A0ABR5A804_9BACL|nr:TetR family transcriptional regulator [Cohnella kolymensis]KIL37100.1 TetR family transcriptional regulator [Cohnella kolymensis]